MPDSYASSSYDHYLCLKPPLLLWLAVFYLSRGVTLPIAMAIGNFTGVDTQALTFFRGLWNVEALFPAAISVIVLYAFIRRSPGASRPTRWIWAHRRALLSASAGLDIVLALFAPIQHWEINDQAVLALCTAVADLYFLAYILAAKRVRDTFTEFPILDSAGK